jgi:Predicted nucleotidyltransferase
LQKLIKKQFKNKPYTIKRVGADYNDQKLISSLSSATAIRKYLKSSSELFNIKDNLPLSSFNIIMQLMDEKYKFIFPEHIFRFIKYKALTDFDGSMSRLADSGEGLYNRIYNAVSSADSLEELMSSVKTKDILTLELADCLLNTSSVSKS